MASFYFTGEEIDPESRRGVEYQKLAVLVDGEERETANKEKIDIGSWIESSNIFNVGENEDFGTFQERPEEELHCVKIRDVFIDPLPQQESQEVSKSLSILLEEDERELLGSTIAQIAEKFLCEFESSKLRAFAFDAIIGYLETGRLNTDTKLIAALGLVMCVNGRTSTELTTIHPKMAAVFFIALKYGCLSPMVQSNSTTIERKMFDENQLFFISKLATSTPDSANWSTPLKKIREDWIIEYLKTPIAWRTNPVDFLKKVTRHLEIDLKRWESQLCTSLCPEAFDKSKNVVIEVLLAKIDKLALRRYNMRRQILLARQALTVKSALQDLVPEWNSYERILTDSDVICDEMLKALPKPESSCSANELIWLPLPREDEPETDISHINSEHHIRLTALTSEINEVPSASELQQLLLQSFKEALNIQQKKLLMDGIKSKSIDFRQINSANIQELVENNPAVAVEVLLKVIDSRLSMKTYLSALIGMDMSVHSMEVVNRLTSTISLPKEFICLYISNCIKTCESFEDKYVQNRLVRLLCVFLQSLIRNQIIDIQDIYGEVMVFLLSFSRIREAAALYRLIRHVESEDSEVF